MEEVIKKDSEMAIIGFWKQADKDVFKCYHYFYVPNPMMRETRISDRKGWGRESGTPVSL